MRKKKLKPTDYLNLRGKKSHPFKSPQESDEASIGGTMADLESDDNSLKAAHDMGIGLSEDYEHPKELDIAGDVEKAEKHKRTH